MNTVKAVNFEQIINRIKEILTVPDSAWENIKAENRSIPDIYKSYVAILAAIPALSSLIQTSIIGVNFGYFTYRVPFFSGLISAVVMYFISLALLYVFALVLEKLAPKFQGSTTIDNTFRLVAYSATPAYVASIFVIIPWIGFLVALAGAIYSIYLLVKGLPKFVEIQDDKKVVYIGASLLSIFIIAFIVNFVAGTMLPGASAGSIHTPQGQIDLQDFERKAKEFENMFKR